ncbi:flagellar motor protein MotB [Devosia sp.]|uniref:flagellar motor protein MotB n=1 Tax=Devosia sp. TaxID=1871048 RepID=UPI003A8F4FF2
MAKKPAPGGVPEWMVTFADLMSILVCFFVLLISFSIQDTERLQVVAGSMRDAFGVVKERTADGMIERQGNPERDYLKNVSPELIDPEKLSHISDVHDDRAEAQGPEIQTQSEENDLESEDRYALAAASIRQAWQDMPDITRFADNLQVEETEDGLEIIISDRNGMRMFPEGSKFPLETTRKAIAALGPILNRLSAPLSITGHVASGSRFASESYDEWDLSTDRANVTRRILSEFGLSPSRLTSVEGAGSSDPIFANDPYLSSNERVTIKVHEVAPPVPPDLSP